MTWLRIALVGSFALAWRVAAPGPEESATMTPATGVSGAWGTWTFQYVVGESDIATGGSVRVQLPDLWHGYYRNSAHAVQTVDQFAPNYVSARVSNAAVRIAYEVEGDGWRETTRNLYAKHRKMGIDGRPGRYVFLLRISVESGTLQQGDTLTVTYGDTSEGSPGWYGPIVAPNREPVEVAVDYTGNGEFRRLENPPTLTALPGAPVELVATATSDAVAGQAAELHLTFLDLNYNAARGTTRSVRLEVIEGQADCPAQVAVPADRGWVRIPVTPRAPGIVRVRATAAPGNLTALSNPMQVHRTRPDRVRHWGDLHSHGYKSWDGVGADYFPYARDVADLDFYALTDHIGANITREDVVALAEEVREYYQPERFVTLLAYEASYGPPYGHHNIFFRGTDVGFVATPQEMPLTELLNHLRAGYAIAIPHGLGHEPRVERHPRVRNFEIYSLWGTAELNDQLDGLSYFMSDWKTNRLEELVPARYDNPGYLRNMWRNNIHLSVIASTDDHRGRPGKRRGGIAAVYTPDLTRESVFDAVQDRYTYGTTGDRILLDFRVNGVMQGREVSASGAPTLRLETHGTDTIAWIEIVRLVPDGDYAVLRTVRPEAMDATVTLTDDQFGGAAMYFVRLRQKEPVRGRPVQAWSSPIWVNWPEEG